jgi:hypothetical protein
MFTHTHTSPKVAALSSMVKKHQPSNDMQAGNLEVWRCGSDGGAFALLIR